MKLDKKMLIDFRNWRVHPEYHFRHQLWNLIMKADGFNRLKLRTAFPEEVEIFMKWQSAKTEDDFFLEYGLKNASY